MSEVFFNPSELNVFTEEEINYNQSILKKIEIQINQHMNETGNNFKNEGYD
jgi:hypothetical protein